MGKLSLLVHPDRCPEALKPDAKRAFTVLNNCKKDLETKEFVVKLKHQINEARRRVVEREMIQNGTQFLSEPSNKRQRTELAQDVTQGKPPQLESKEIVNEEPSEEAIRKELKEILIDCAWQKRIEDQASQKLEQQTLARREELKAEIKAKKKYSKEWE